MRLPDRSALMGFPDADPVVTVNKNHDARCLVHDEAQQPWLGLMLDCLPGQVTKVQDCDVKNF